MPGKSKSNSNKTPLSRRQSNYRKSKGTLSSNDRMVIKIQNYVNMVEAGWWIKNSQRVVKW
jgi:hypothetical protein